MEKMEKSKEKLDGSTTPSEGSEIEDSQEKLYDAIAPSKGEMGKSKEKLEGTTTPSEAKKRKFINAIKEIYQELFNRIQPIPFLKEKCFCVNNVFVDSGIEWCDPTRPQETWELLSSYNDIFMGPRQGAKRFILFGEPGYGKSTLALQFVYDWYDSCPKSPLKDKEILIFLKLKDVGGITSIYCAIKQLLLPQESKLKESDIEECLDNSESVVIVLDGFDEYAPVEELNDDFTKIIKGLMFPKFLVVLTTRLSFKPIEMAAQTIQIRLTGFDSRAQDEYAQKVVAGDDEKAVKNIKTCLEQNPIVNDLCEVPLFFTLTSHMIYNNEIPQNSSSVTSFFKYLIGCFCEHTENNLNLNNEDEDGKLSSEEEKHLSKLYKLSFDLLAKEDQKKNWTRKSLLKSIGRELYDQLVKVGIFVEEKYVAVDDKPRMPTSPVVQWKTRISFCHKLFCEWFAAHYLSTYATKQFALNFSKTFKRLDPFALQYMFRFACGINQNASAKIIKYLKKLDGGDKFALLCILERKDSIGEIEGTIKQMCSEGVVISGYDSLLLQRSSVQLLEVAAKINITIKLVVLTNCFDSVDLPKAAIRTTSGLILTSSIPIEKLRVSLYNRDMTEDEAYDILQFASMCPSLQLLM